jgi:beta-lactamase superfamily II metal-dependent hydrolase
MPASKLSLSLVPRFRKTILVRMLFVLLVSSVSVSLLHAQQPDTSKALQIYFIDVEGGQATLFVTPTGQSLLIDTGWPGNNGRDADRIIAAAKDAKLTKIDYVLITHFHDDHVGGFPQLADKFPIGKLIDHGENRESSDPPTERDWQAYLKAVDAHHFTRVHPKVGDLLPLTGVEARVISSDGVVLAQALPGAGQPNPTCSTSRKADADHTENFRSLGTLFTFGKLRILDLGDLTADQEWDLMCPANKLGLIDIYIVSHHGWSQSGSPAFLNGIAPRLAIMDNGAKKGGSPSSWDVIEKSPRLAQLWQVHYSEEGGEAHNVPAQFIANPQGPDAANYLKLTAWPDGAVNIFNSRTKETKHYAPNN